MISDRTILLVVALLLVAPWAAIFLYYFIRKRLHPPRERLVDFLKTHRFMLAPAVDVDSCLAIIEEKGALAAVTMVLEQAKSLPPGYWKFLHGVKDELEKQA